MDGLMDWLAADEGAAAAGCCVSPPEQLSAPRTLYLALKKLC
jgi:hypothetical protein